MTGRTNTGGAASGGVKGAVIGVIFPEGATVSVSNGTKTYTSKDTDGNTAFSVEAGTWTVTAAQGEDSDSKEVTVEEGDFVTVELRFWNGNLYDAGDQYTDITGGWVKVRGTVTFNETSIRVTGGASNADSIVSTANKIDLKGFTTLHINISLNTTDGVSGDFQVYDADAASEIIKSDNVATIQANKKGEYELDISSLAAGSNTQYFVGYNVSGTSGVTRYYEFDKVWMT